MSIRKLMVGLLVVLGGSGCGLDVTLTAVPNPTQAGNNVNFNLTVTNQTNCAMDEVTALIAGGPTFDPLPADICSRCQNVTSYDEWIACLEPIIGPIGMDQLMTQARMAADSAVPALAGTCSITGLAPNEVAECSLDPLAALASDSVQFTAPAPASGPMRYFAFVIGASADPDCPTILADSDAPSFPPGATFGCGLAQAASGQAAPVLSPFGVAAAAVLLLVTGLWGIRRSWRARA